MIWFEVQESSQLNFLAWWPPRNGWDYGNAQNLQHSLDLNSTGPQKTNRSRLKNDGWMIAFRLGSRNFLGPSKFQGVYLSTHHLAKSLVPPAPTRKDHNSPFDAIPLLEDDVGILVAALQAPDSSSAMDPPCGVRFQPFCLVLGHKWFVDLTVLSLPDSTTKPRRTLFWYFAVVLPYLTWFPIRILQLCSRIFIHLLSLLLKPSFEVPTCIPTTWSGEITPSSKSITCVPNFHQCISLRQNQWPHSLSGRRNPRDGYCLTHPLQTLGLHHLLSQTSARHHCQTTRRWKRD